MSARRWRLSSRGVPSGWIRAGLLVALPTIGLGVVSPVFAATSPVGPDVSAWQHPSNARIDWASVATSGQRFAFIKATQSNWYTNPYFSPDLRAARGAGMLVGAYHFADPSVSPLIQADDFAKAIVSVSGTNLPPVLDLEESGGLTPAALSSWVTSFLGRLQADTGRTPMIYTYPAFWLNDMGNTSNFSSYPLWLADYTSGSPLVPGGWSGYALWQYTDAATIPGIPGAVDDSLACCDLTGLVQQAGLPASETAFLTALAADVTGTPLDATTEQLYGDALTAGTTTRSAVAANLLTSPAGLTAVVDAAYRAYLGRGADPAGQAAFVGALEHGLTWRQLRTALVGSPEFYSRAGATPAGFLDAAYRVLLGRPVDQGGVASWSATLAAGRSTSWVATQLQNSAEGRAYAVAQSYLQVLGRQVDPLGLTDAVSYLNRGGHLPGLVESLYGSAEYLQRAIAGSTGTGFATPGSSGSTSATSTPSSPPPTATVSPSPTASPAATVSPSPTASPAGSPSPTPTAAG